MVGFASDGDPKLLKAMLYETKFLSRVQLSKWGRYFIINNDQQKTVCIQDTIHLLNKIRNKLLNSAELKIGKPLYILYIRSKVITKLLIIGTIKISKDHIQKLIDEITEDRSPARYRRIHQGSNEI